MDTNQGYKNRALASLKGKWDKGVLAAFIYLLLSQLPSVPSLLSFSGDDQVFSSYISNGLFSILLIPLTWGLVVFFLYIVRGEYAEIESLFDGYKAFKRIFFTKLMVNIYTFLWTLLLIVPGVIKFYSYAMTDYLLRDEADLEYDAAIERSMQMMEGHKLELFYLHLSFIGWAILSVFTCGFGLFLLIPYFYTAQAHFYEDLKAQYGNGNFSM